jgi:hypothetical protein
MLSGNKLCLRKCIDHTVAECEQWPVIVEYALLIECTADLNCRLEKHSATMELPLLIMMIFTFILAVMYGHVCCHLRSFLLLFTLFLGSPLVTETNQLSGLPAVEDVIVTYLSEWSETPPLSLL